MIVECEKCSEQFEYDFDYYLGEPVQCDSCGHYNYVLDFK